MGGRLPEFCKKALSPINGISLTAAIVIAAVMTVAYLAGASLLYFAGKDWRWLPVDLISDINVYFDSARWVVEGGGLYRETSSDYPLLPNIIFAVMRYLSNLLHAGRNGFYVLWIASTWSVYLYALYRIVTGTTVLAGLAWLAPGSIYFAVSRFDIYPAVATLMALFAIRRTRYIEGAIWLGVAAALKGYALWLLPAYCVFMIYQRGFAAAIKVGALVVAPMIMSLLLTLIFTGWEGMIAPFSSQALRTFNGESTYDALNYLFSHFDLPIIIPNGPEMRWIAHSLQVACALAAAAMRPRSFDDLVNAFLFAVLGFVSFSVFYSPQFVLWILPLVSFSRSWVMLTSAIGSSWLAYVYFPISYFRFRSSLFKPTITAVSLLRIFMMVLTLREHFRHLSPRAHPKMIAAREKIQG